MGESYKIGRLLRQHQAAVSRGYCASSCVFVSIGGTERITTPSTSGSMAKGLVIHQPHATPEFQTSSSPWAKAMLRELKNYFVGMTGSAAFHNAMIVVPF